MVTGRVSGSKAQKQESSKNERILDKALDSLNVKIIRELISNPNASSTEIASKYNKPLSTIQRRRARLEQTILTKSYGIDLAQLGWRTADLLISVEKGKTEETARKLLEEQRTNIIATTLRIGDPQVDIMADIFYRDSIELHSLIERVKSMPYVTYVEWAELVKVVGSNYNAILEKVFDRQKERR